MELVASDNIYNWHWIYRKCELNFYSQNQIEFIFDNILCYTIRDTKHKNLFNLINKQQTRCSR